jgi:membrane protease YdiL (CAAX protease family)
MATTDLGVVAGRARPSAPATFALSCLVAALAILGSFAVAVANQAWFDLVNGYVGAEQTVIRGVLFSSWLLLIGGAVVITRPAAFGLRMGDTVRCWRLVGASLAGGAAVTALVVRLTGSTPYSDASLFIECVVVPLTEELVFRAVLLTILLAVLVRLHPLRTATILAIGIDGVAFGLAHLANAATLELGWVMSQVTFASALGMACAALMVRTRSVVPAVLLHAVVNGVVVLI